MMNRSRRILMPWEREFVLRGPTLAAIIVTALLVGGAVGAFFGHRAAMRGASVWREFKGATVVETALRPSHGEQGERR
jgi:hypothetical protein